MRGCWILCSRGARGVGGTGGECEGGGGDGVCLSVQLFGCWNSGAQLRLGAKEIYWTPVEERRHRGAIWQKKSLPQKIPRCISIEVLLCIHLIQCSVKAQLGELILHKHHRGILVYFAT